MNVVAKGYVAAQDAGRMRIASYLSRFAGAAVECEAALLVPIRTILNRLGILLRRDGYQIPAAEVARCITTLSLGS